MGIIISVTEVGPRGPAVDAAFYNGKGEAERGFVQPLSTNVTTTFLGFTTNRLSIIFLA